MTPRTLFEANITALTELTKADPDLNLLALYSGWADARVRNFAFDIVGTLKPELRPLFAELNINPSELVNAGALTAYFTPPEVCSAMWQIALRALGRPPTSIIEPSAGTGRFLSTQPVLSALECQRLAIEPDPIYSRILRARFPSWSVRACCFEDAGLQHPCADLIIGNVPFGDWGVVDRHAAPDLRHKHLQARVHDYFVCKAVSLLLPGGVAALITHGSTMDREETGVREWLAERAEIVTAARLPANLWDSQGASVIADVLVLRRTH